MVTEAASAGTDTVRTTLATYTLSANLENLVFIGNGSFSGTGNASDNVLTGGAGNDTLVGRAGNDTYVVDNTGDVVTEAAGRGHRHGADHARGVHARREPREPDLHRHRRFTGTGNAVANVITGGAGNDTLDGGAGADTLNGVGGNDTLLGGADNDTLNGSTGNDTLDGGTGTDTMAGGTGNDTYVVDVAADVVTEAAAEGTDTVRTALASYTLGANVENLTFTGTGNFSGTGNTLDNVITGGAGVDTLNGGDGNDTLNGGAGNDTLIGGIGQRHAASSTAPVTSSPKPWAGAPTPCRPRWRAYTLGANLENLTFTGTGAFTGTGNAPTTSSPAARVPTRSTAAAATTR